jgi:hypothetical protein
VDVEVVIEIPEGRRNKYEMDHATGQVGSGRRVGGPEGSRGRSRRAASAAEDGHWHRARAPGEVGSSISPGPGTAVR